MATAYTSLLGLALPVTGELSGTWGDTVNNSITSLLDSAIAGTTTLSSDADVTLTTTTGASNTSRQAILLWTAGGTVTRNITAPAQSKIYTVINKSSSTQSIVLRGVGPTTGVTIVKGESAVCAWNGSDFIKISNTSGAGVFTTVTASSLTSGRVTYATTAGLLTDSANLLYSGTDLTVYGLTVGRGAGAVNGNTTLGNAALVGSNTGTGLTAIGYTALATNTSGTNNTAVGFQALVGNNSGSNNTALGKDALVTNTTASNNTAVGYQAGYTNSTATQLTAFGVQAGYTNNANNNAFFGYQAGYFNSTGTNNAAFGAYRPLYTNSSGSFNTAIGDQALVNNTTASNNTAVGYQAGYSNTTGTRFTAIGAGAGYGATGDYNTLVGYNSGRVNTGTFNTAVGDTNLGSNTATTSTGSYNCAFGQGTLAYLSSGSNNSAYGFNANVLNTTGSNNTAMGMQALNFNTTASNNTAVGYQAGYNNTTSTDNTFIGYVAGYTFNTTGQGFNAAIGRYAGYGLTTGTRNTFVGGTGSGYLVTTGAANTILGCYTGNQGGLDIRTSSNRVVLSDGDGNVRYFHDGSATGILYPNIGSLPNSFYAWDTARFYPNPDNALNLGLSSNRFNTVFATVGTINTSDKNEKQDIQELSALELAVAQEIKGLFKTYRWKSAVAEKGDAARIHVGVIAQDVQEAFAKHGLDASRYALWCSDTWYEVDGKASLTAAEPFTAETPNAVPKTRLGIRYDQLLAFVISAL